MTGTDKRIQDLNTLKIIAEKLNEATDIKDMLNDVLKELLHVTDLSTGWIFLIDEKGHYKLAADHDLPTGLTWKQKKPMCEGGCWCVDRYQAGRLKKAINIISCKRIEEAIEHNWGETNGITHHATVPLRAGKENFGLLNVASPNKKHFSEEELALLESVAFQIGTAIKRIQLVEKERAHALVKERNRLAQDLHDSVNQLLFSIMLTARGTKEMTDQADVKEMLTYMQELSQEALNEMKGLIWQLRPQGLEDGIATALIHYGNVLGLNISCDIEGVCTLPQYIEEELWRIGQEALNNCKKHAETTEVNVSLSKKDVYVKMMIEDYGRGFHYDESVAIPSLGLKGMKERVERLNGNFKLISLPGKGTKIEVAIPLSKGG
ncbi:GAF domain-containing sensor histidine kinase [Metabacillus halosaccharovorans]|uniref:GAF domain-containing sensor histidine kinase n=1 Tax=Metabacillus halosaccharovorans TaxID=930124 RepID=UPI00203A6566|nr:GAF domain-containing sensor histidine kinase [Metabacillus halosaccharovorans]MCM3443179.1 GAF domain-containing sensor histidine kinase [Metabacillus halosaccharovorans]